MIRSFVAISIPDDVADELASIAYGLPGARWVSDYHLTLRFLGEVDGATLLDIQNALKRVRLSPFSLQLSSLGSFPPRGKPKVLWAGVTASDPLVRLKRKVDNSLRHFTITSDHKRFTPHVTMARFSGGADTRIGHYLAGNGLFRSREFDVTSFGLFRSQLTPSGAIYTPIQTYRLNDSVTTLPVNDV